MDRPSFGPTPTMAAMPLMEVELVMLRIFAELMRVFFLVLGGENLSPQENDFTKELNKQLARGFRRNLIYIIRWGIQSPSSAVSVFPPH